MVGCLVVVKKGEWWGVGWWSVGVKVGSVVVVKRG